MISNASSPRGKNIVLLSDGTGNSAGMMLRTNVWRLCAALERDQSGQAVFYDDGVGTQGFLPFKLLGGAFGWGLKRNVIELYVSLCHAYRPGDRVFLFGFSRGAYTVRTVVGLIHHHGLIADFTSRHDLNKKAKAAYADFRTIFSRGLVNDFSKARKKFAGIRRGLRRGAAAALDRDSGLQRQSKPPPAANQRPEIEFVGVWDTVDAVGFPIDEIADFWNYFIWPFRFPDRRLSPLVKRACHALALEDERRTFHPVLWDESDSIDQKRIEQVWFAGAHANVGGGYADDNLALVALDWMMTKAAACGLKFSNGKRARIRAQADAHGKLHDSRCGAAAYYRYKPRDVRALCNDQTNGVAVPEVKILIHESVFRRISDNLVPYAPLGIPARYGIEPAAVAPETPTEAAGRIAALNHALDKVFWRGRLYVAFVLASLGLAATRWFLDWSPDRPCGAGRWCLFDDAFKAALSWTPDALGPWLDAWRQNPCWFFGFLIILVMLYLMSGRLRRKTSAAAAAAWSHLKNPPGDIPQWTPTLTARLRALYGPRCRSVMNAVVGLLGTATGVFLILVIANKVAFEFRLALGSLCVTSAAPERLAPGLEKKTTLAVDQPCLATGIDLEKEGRYRISVIPRDAAAGFGWKDGDIAAGPSGFADPHDAFRWPLLTAAGARRVWTEDWFKLMGRIGAAGADQFPIGDGLHDFTAQTKGELFLFVNDAVCGLCPGKLWAWPYFWPIGKNTGEAIVTVKRLKKEE